MVYGLGFMVIVLMAKAFQAGAGLAVLGFGCQVLSTAHWAKASQL